MATTCRSILTRILGAFSLAASLAAGAAPTVFTVTNTNDSGAGSLAGILAGLDPDTSACPADGVRIEFNIPAATDPGCDSGTGICKVLVPDEVFLRCGSMVIDGYSQPGATPNTATDYTNNAQIRIELDNLGPSANKTIRTRGVYNLFGYNSVNNVSVRGLAIPRHMVELAAGNNGSVAHSGSGRVFAGNWVGWHANGARATGVVSRGVYVWGAFISDVTIGGPLPADRNLFTYRDTALCCEGTVVAIRGSGASGALIEGNYINVAPDGTFVPANGIVGAINLDSNGNTPYSQDSVVRNNVIYNVNAGVPVNLAVGPGITMSRNVITGHPGHLRAWAFSPAPEGANSQVLPVITGVTEAATEVLVFGTAQSGADRTVRIEFFHNTVPYQAGAARTERYVGSVDVTVDGSGNGSFTASLPADTRNVAASATNLTSGETSLLNAGPPPPAVFMLNLSKAGPGIGTVSSASPAISCTGTCAVAVAKDLVVSLTATPQSGSAFTGWSGDCSGTGQCTVTMNDNHNVVAHYTGGSGPPVIGNAPLSVNVASAVPFSFTYSVTGLFPFSFSLEPDCTLPAGLALNPSTGTMSGTPGSESERFICTLRVSNGIQPDALQDYEIRASVGPGTPLFTGGATLPPGTTGVVYSQAIAVQGTSPIAFTLTSGTLPPGLTLASNGTLAGTPTQVGTYTFRARAAGPDGATSGLFSVVVAAGVAPQVTSAAPPNRPQFNAYSHTFTASGTPPFAWSVASGTLPTGLTLDPTTGVLSGLPTVAGTFSFTVQVANGTPPAATQAASIAISFNGRTVTVSKTGQGSGTVASTPAGIDCGATCNAPFQPGSTVTLAATPAADSVFDSWSGACTGSGECSLSMSVNRAVQANFDLRRFEVQVTRAGGGGGVNSNPATITCSSSISNCTGSFTIGSTITLFAINQIGFRFVGWSGACSGSATSCVLTIDGPKQVTATFEPAPSLTVTKSGAGSGTVTSSPAGIDCGAACVIPFAQGTSVTLTATPANGSIFVGWGNGCSGTGTCTVTLNNNTSVTATFAQGNTLTVTKAGTGSGAVTSNVVGIDCGPACSATFANDASVTLAASPAAGSVFSGWSGACTGTGACTVTMNAARSVTATFAVAVATAQLSITVGSPTNAPAGFRSIPAGLTCTLVAFGAQCSGTFPLGSLVQVIPVPQRIQNYPLGTCEPAEPACTVRLNGNRSFQVGVSSNASTVRVSRSGPPGAGAVSIASSLFTKDCPASTSECSVFLLGEDNVVITATPAAEHLFLGWDTAGANALFALPGCNAGTTTCAASLSDPVIVANSPPNQFNVLARFSAIPKTIDGVSTEGSKPLERSTRIATPFAPAPMVKVRDRLGNTVAGARLTFTAIAGPTGASALRTDAVVTYTGADGIGSAPFTANGIAGTWTLRVRAEAGPAQVFTDFVMKNTNDVVPIRLPGEGRATIPATGTAGVVLQVKVTRADGTKLPGARVTFTAPASPNSLGAPVPSGTLVPSTTTTDSSGIARTRLLSNGVAGTFVITVRVTPPVGLPLQGASAGFEGDDYVTELTVEADATLADAVVTDPNGDYDKDGIPNAVEDAEGTLPFNKDNDVFADSRLFAMQQYRDFLGREGDAAGVTHWTNQLSGGAQTRAQMAETYFNSAEFQGTAAPVVRLYFAYFLRIPDYDGLNFWIGQFRGGTSLETISNAFAGSPEFANRYGTLTNSQFVSLVYQNVLGRAPDAPGLAHWTGQINGGMTRGRMMLEFSESAEYRALITNEVFVTMMYGGMLRRAPDAVGFSFWVNYLDAGNSGLALTQGFVDAPEYRARFLP